MSQTDRNILIKRLLRADKELTLELLNSMSNKTLVQLYKNICIIYCFTG
ncbi:MAG TPA: hypothetical protein PLK68_07700 [Thomasclavelia ramosa]|nr:hypothetical protein [Thomasclavelia ramosa]